MMKLIVSTFLLASLMISCQNTPEKTEEIGTDIIKNPNTASGKSNEAIAVMTFDEIRYEFGEILEGESVEHKFAFTNTGDAPLLITNVRAECGCTVPNDWPKQPVKSGEKATVSVVFNSTGKQGKQVKRLTISANTSPSDNVVALSGTVIKNK